MKRNTIVTGVVLLVLATFAWAGWANWQYRKQAAEKRLANVSQAELVEAGDAQAALNPLIGKPAPQFSLEDLSGKKVSLADLQRQGPADQFLGDVVRPLQGGNPLDRGSAQPVRGERV